MYCKNCGKYLEEGTRFCDRCGQSVRKNANSEQAVRHQNIEELKEERLNRKKRLAEMEAREAMKNKRKKKRRKQNRGLAAFMIIVVLLAILSVVIAYSLMRSSSSITDGGNSEIVPSPQATQAASGNTAVNQTSIPQGTSNPVQNGQQGSQTSSSDDYRVFEINNIACPYPSDFSKKSVSGNEKLSLVDSAGGGIMSISQEQGVRTVPSEQMKDYASQLGGSVSYSLADKNGYAITVEKNNTVYHRKCIMSGSSAIYYDFQYSAMSSARARYEQCVSYIDNNMTAK